MLYNENKKKCNIQPGNPVQYFIIGNDNARKEFETAKQEVITSTVERIKRENTLVDCNEQFKLVSPILVTGSSGYLGSAIVEVLREHDVLTIGIDLVGAPTTDCIGCISDINILRKLSSHHGCKSVIHTASLHAPNLDYYSEVDFRKVNVDGTQNILSIAKEFAMKAVIYSSTTSLMITNEVKERELEKNHIPVILNESVDYGIPRNIYGITKKLAEKLCKEEKCINIAILRCSRFFVEDKYDTGVKTLCRNIQKTNGNVKANEILCGTRASLEDTVIAHLIALTRMTKAKSIPHENKLIGPLIISAISPLLTDTFDVSVVSNGQLYTSRGWSLPEQISRVYDSTNSWKILNYTPKWDFKRLMEHEDVMNINKGWY